MRWRRAGSLVSFGLRDVLIQTISEPMNPALDCRAVATMGFPRKQPTDRPLSACIMMKNHRKRKTQKRNLKKHERNQLTRQTDKQRTPQEFSILAVGAGVSLAGSRGQALQSADPDFFEALDMSPFRGSHFACFFWRASSSPRQRPA